MSRKCCRCKCKCKCKKRYCCDDDYRHCGGSGCSGFNACTALPTLLILCQSGLLNNDRAYILFLLFWLCGGTNANGCGQNCC